jgi:hypothetical protein
MDSFAKFHTNHRHRGHGFTDTQSSYRRKHLNLVPDYVKTDASKNQKIENLKTNKGTCACTPADLEYIRDTFNIIPHKDKDCTLGKTGIRFFFNPQTNTFMLQK